VFAPGIKPACIAITYPVTEEAGASVGGLDVSDEGEMTLFGKKQQQQTLHPHRCDLDSEGDTFHSSFYI